MKSRRRKHYGPIRRSTSLPKDWFVTSEKSKVDGKTRYTFHSPHEYDAERTGWKEPVAWSGKTVVGIEAARRFLKKIKKTKTQRSR